ncbi:MAG TPA: CBS domain-containing protein [Longimicrobiales bacterium]
MKISDILRSKGSACVTVHPDIPVTEALRTLVEHDIGAVVVVDDTIKGIFTERDVLRAAASDIQRLAHARVRDLMTVDVVTATPDHDIQHVMNVMTEHRIRHLPVVAGGEVRGMISIRDVVNALRQTAENENQQLHAYITGTPL